MFPSRSQPGSLVFWLTSLPASERSADPRSKQCGHEVVAHQCQVPIIIIVLWERLRLEPSQTTFSEKTQRQKVYREVWKKKRTGKTKETTGATVIILSYNVKGLGNPIKKKKICTARRSWVQIQVRMFLCGFYMFSLCLCRLSSGTPLSSHSPKTSKLGLD